MKNKVLLLTGMLAGILLSLIVITSGLLSGPSTGQAAAGIDSSGSVSQQATPAAPWKIESQDEISPDSAALPDHPAAPGVLPTPIPGETLVYFVTTDNDATATVLYLTNTDSVAHTVALRGYSYNGVLVYSLNINIGATTLLKLASDSIAAAPPPSWATPAPILTNFTDFTYFASLSLPKGVKAEGYTLFNPGTGVVDPRADQGAIPLRFSTDPASVFLPSVQSAP